MRKQAATLRTIGFLLLLPLMGEARIYECFQPCPNQSDEFVLQYQLMTPARVESSRTCRLLIFLYGAGEWVDDNERQLNHGLFPFATSQMRQQHPACVIARQCQKGEHWISGAYASGGKALWYPEPSVKQIVLMRIPDDLIEHASVDPNGISVIGHAMGGAGTGSLIDQYHDRFGAAIPVCGRTCLPVAEQFTQIPILIFDGSDDNGISSSVSRTMAEALPMASGNLFFTAFEGITDDSWSPVFVEQPAINNWLFTQKIHQ